MAKIVPRDNCRRLAARLSARNHASPSLPTSRTKEAWLPMRSALGRDHLNAQLARGMGLRVHVDVPIACCELLCLLGRQGRLPAYRISGRGARSASQTTTGPLLPGTAGPWKCARVTALDSPLYGMFQVTTRVAGS